MIYNNEIQLTKGPAFHLKLATFKIGQAITSISLFLLS